LQTANPLKKFAKKFHYSTENENKTYQHLLNTVKTVLRRKFITQLLPSFWLICKPKEGVSALAKVVSKFQLNEDWQLDCTQAPK
jgi:hypothetical protein